MIAPATHALPDRRRTADGAVIVLATLAVMAALWLGRAVFVPLALSITIATVLRPLVRIVERAHVPAAAAAAIVVLAVLLLLVGIGMALEQPVRGLADELPQSITKARATVNEGSARVRGLLRGGGGSPAGRAAGSDSTAAHPRADPARPAASDSAASRAPAPPGALRSAFGITASLTMEIVEEVLLVLFLLAAGDAWVKKLARIARSPSRAERWTSIAGEMHDVVARYLWVTLLINLGQAVVIGLAVWAIGLPSPLLWAALTFVAEWVPYLGGLTMVVLLLLAGLTRSEGLAHALLAPGAYLIVTTLQNNLVSPIAYGRGLRLNPTMILFGVMFWWMVWQAAGAFLAVPILAALHVLGARIDALKPIGVLLEE